MYRVKQKGRYRFKCPTCGVYIKTKAPHCRRCVLDLLESYTPGSWKKTNYHSYPAVIVGKVLTM